MDEHAATRIFTLGELIAAFESASVSEAVIGRSWKEIIEAATQLPSREHHIFNKRPFLNPASLVAMRLLKLLARMFFHLRCFGLDKLPHGTPFLICPESRVFS